MPTDLPESSALPSRPAPAEAPSRTAPVDVSDAAIRESEREAAAHDTVAVNDAADKDSIMNSLRELWEHRLLIRELTQRDLKLRYKNSIGGIAWSLLNPILQIAVITLVMKFIQVRPIGSYSAYLFGIIFLWSAFQTALLDGCTSVLTNANLVRKVYFPRAILPIVSLISNGFHFIIAFAFTIVYFFVLGTYPEQIRPQILMVIPAIFFTAVLALGLSFILAYLNVLYEDVRFITQAILQLLFYAMPVFFTIEQVAALPKIYPFYMMNPLSALLVTYQRALLSPPAVPDTRAMAELSASGKTHLAGTVPNLPPIDIPWGYFALACVTSTVILLVGFRLFEHYKWEIAERL